MNCKKAAGLLLRALDGRLGEKERRQMEAHLLNCASCRAREKEYREVLDLLRPGRVPEPLPHFETRLMAKLRESERARAVLVWPKWAARAAAACFLVGLFFGAGLLFFQPRESLELSQAEILLLRNENPLTEAATILDQKKPEERNMMLIFAAAEMRPPVGR